MSRRPRPRQPAHPVQSVTSAPRSHREDQQQRIRSYLLSMGIRTLCFVLAVVFLVVLEWAVIGWICAVAAAVLPYFAVLIANASRYGGGGSGSGPVSPQRQLPPGPSGPRGDGA